MKTLFTLLVFTISFFTANAQLTTLGTGSSAGVNDFVYDLQADTANDLLYVGGRFTTAGNIFSPFISAWDGNSWTSLGSGLDGYVRTMCLFNGDLIVGGEFLMAGDSVVNHIARWDGTYWHPMGEGFDDRVQSLCVFNNQLYAGGRFQMSGATQTRLIAKWNGTDWQELSEGLSTSFTTFVPTVFTMLVFQNQLYMGGYFHSTNGQGSIDGNLVKWNGFNWVDVDNYVSTSVDLVTVLASRDDILWVGGAESPFIQTFDGVNWLSGSQSPLPQFTVNGDVYGISFYDGLDIIGGGFDIVGASGVTSQYNDEFIQSVENEDWGTLGGGVNNSVFCTEVFQDELYFGGAFPRINDGFVLANYVARWKSPLRVNASHSNLSCNGSADGSATMTPNSGTGPYTYNWSDIGMAGATRTGLVAGTYTCTITDASGRTTTKTVTVTQPGVINVSFNVTGTTGTNGSIQATVTGGTAPYNLQWSNGQTGTSLSGLAQGTYSVTVEDANNCTGAGSAVVDTLVAGIEDANRLQLELYPNPANTFVYLQSGSNYQGAVRISVTDLAGKLVQQTAAYLTGTAATALNVSQLKNGPYILSVYDAQGVHLYSGRLLKQ